MKWWNAYTKLINRHCSDPGSVTDLSYWRNNLFAGTVIYILPFSLIALIPGLYLDFISNLYGLGITDLATFICMLVIAFVPAIRLKTRKIIFTCCMYTLSGALLWYLGLFGPGLVFLLASCLFSILIFEKPKSFRPAWLNAAICLLFAFALVFQLTPRNTPLHYGAVEWMGVSSNVIFLSFLFVALIPRLFNGLQETIEKEKLLKEKLDIQQQSLQHALIMLEEKNNELEQFAYVTSHDLKEPVRMVTSFMGLLKDKYQHQLDEKANTYIGFAIDGGRRMQNMIADLLELSRTGRQGSKEPADLNDILKLVQQNIRKLVEENRAKIIIKNPLPVLNVYKTDIASLFQNLLSNAIKFRQKEADPVIKIAADEKDSEWLFSIADNGIGVDQSEFAKIFEVFVRLHSRETYEGTGIGLAVCKKVIEQHGGQIRLESAAGAGTTFYFTIKK